MKRILIESSALFGLSKFNVAKLKNFKTYTSPTNVFEILTHTKSCKVNNPEGFVISKLKILKELNSEMLLSPEATLKKEVNRVLKRSQDTENTKIFDYLCQQILDKKIKLSDNKIQKILIEPSLQATSNFAAGCEKTKESIRDYCISPKHEEERKHLYGKPILDYNKDRKCVFDDIFALDGYNKTIISARLSSRDINIELPDIENLLIDNFFINIFESYRNILRQIVVNNRHAEKGDYFDFEFMIYAGLEDIDIVLVNNTRDFHKNSIVGAKYHSVPDFLNSVV